jgi:hypothetical protein
MKTSKKVISGVTLIIALGLGQGCRSSHDPCEGTEERALETSQTQHFSRDTGNEVKCIFANMVKIGFDVFYCLNTFWN